MNNIVNNKNILLKNNLSIWELENIDSSNEELYMSYYNNECLSSKFHNSFLLDKNKEKIDFIEKLVYDLSLFHLKNIDMDIDDNIEIEFLFKTSVSKMHIEEDNYANEIGKLSSTPILSILLQFNDTNNPLLITNIDEESYKYKNFTGENKNLCIIFPKKMRNIVFDCNYYHSEINIFNNDIIDSENEISNMLVINIWHNYKPIKIPIYNCEKYKKHIFNKCKESNFLFKKNNIINIISLNENEQILTKDFFSDMLYKKNVDFKFLSKIFNRENIYQGLYIINETNETNNIEHPLKKMDINYIKYNNLIEKLTILPNIINDIDIKNIIKKFKKYGILNNNNDELFNYVIQNISTRICETIRNSFEIDNVYNIIIDEIKLSSQISTDLNTTIIASVILKDDIIYNDSNEKCNEIELKKGSLVIQNNNFSNKNVNEQIILEFFINVQSI